MLDVRLSMHRPSKSHDGISNCLLLLHLRLCRYFLDEWLLHLRTQRVAHCWWLKPLRATDNLLKSPPDALHARFVGNGHLAIEFPPWHVTGIYQEDRFIAKADIRIWSSDPIADLHDRQWHFPWSRSLALYKMTFFSQLSWFVSMGWNPIDDAQLLLSAHTVRARMPKSDWGDDRPKPSFMARCLYFQRRCQKHLNSPVTLFELTRRLTWSWYLARCCRCG